MNKILFSQADTNHEFRPDAERTLVSNYGFSNMNTFNSLCLEVGWGPVWPLMAHPSISAQPGIFSPGYERFMAFHNQESLGVTAPRGGLTT